MPNLYSGHWPSNVSKTAKYAVKSIQGQSKVTIRYDLGNGLRFLAVETGYTNIVEKVNIIKRMAGDENGVFYINEYQHLIVPVNINGSTHRYFAGKVGVDFKDVDFRFEFENSVLTTKPIDANGNEMSPGDSWHGPRPGIKYVIQANGRDIYYETPALTDTNPQTVRDGYTQTVKLSQYQDDAVVQDVIQPILDGRNGESGRFYVNEHRAIFAPTQGIDTIDYIYCGQIKLEHWFPEPEDIWQE